MSSENNLPMLGSCICIHNILLSEDLNLEFDLSNL